MSRATRPAKTRLAKNQLPRPQQKIPFIEHVYELRKRLFYIAVSVGIFSTLAYAVEHKIIAALLKPAGNQEFIYTSPGGGIDFLFRVCLYVGLGCSIPVIIYQLLRYIEPLVKGTSKRMVVWGSIASGILALVGIVFGYFVGLPSGLDFLLHQFHTNQISALITIQSYMSFVMLYLLGSAMLLQVPLILLFINRIKPLKPQKLLSLTYQRWVILFAFIVSAIINASPQVMAQLVIAVPVILSYEIGIAIIWYVNRHSPYSQTIRDLRQADADRRAERQGVSQRAVQICATPLPPKRHVPLATNDDAAAISSMPMAAQTRPATEPNTPARATPSSAPQPARGRSYVNDFAPRARQQYANGIVSGDGIIAT
jgi:sec-independent protein translocase protein TatC